MLTRKQLLKVLKSDFARRGGQARWADVSSDDRSKAMSEIAKKPRKKKGKKSS